MQPFTTSHLSLGASFFGALLMATGVFASDPAIAADTVSFKDKTVTVLVGSGPGSSTDGTARLVAASLAKHLPGQPTIVAQNRPAAHGMAAMNYFAQQSKPDGLSLIVGSSSQSDPLTYRVPQAQYRPTDFLMIGGINVGGSILMIRNEAMPRLTDRNARPVAMGSVSGVPRTDAQMVVWGMDKLGWNVRWVSGYGNNADLALALERGEVDMTCLGESWFSQSTPLLDTSKYTPLYQTGSDGDRQPSVMSAFIKTPMFSAMMSGRLTDPVMQKAFEYWRLVSSDSKWVALPPKTPPAIVDTYRKAFIEALADQEFVDKAQKVMPGFSRISAEAQTDRISDLAQIPPAALEYMTQMLHAQGLSE